MLGAPQVELIAHTGPLTPVGLVLYPGSSSKFCSNTALWWLKHAHHNHFPKMSLGCWSIHLTIGKYLPRTTKWQTKETDAPCSHGTCNV